MARPLRIEYPGACYHVMNRGNQRQVVFREDWDYELFLEKLGDFAETFEVQVRSYCLLPNHFHLYLCTPLANLSRFMQSFLTSFTISMNKRYRRSGHLFQGRFKGLLIEEEAYGSRLSRYIHLNPIRTRAAAEEEAEALRQQLREFSWSSYPSIIGLRKCPKWLHRKAVLRNWGTRVREQQREYATYVESGLLKNVRDPLEAEAIHGVLGTDGFLDRVRRLVADAAENQDERETGQARRLMATIPLERVIEVVAAEYDEPREELLRRYNRGSEARQMLLYLASTQCRGRQTLTELAAQLGPITLGALTRARQKMEENLAEDANLHKRKDRLIAKLRENP